MSDLRPKVGGFFFIWEKIIMFATMKHLNYTKKGINYTPIKYWKIDSVTEIAIYQGFRGENPELDFILKYKEEGKRLRTPSHTHWIVDLLVKADVNKTDTLRFVNGLIDIYDNLSPFKSLDERLSYVLKYPTKMSTKYQTLQGHGYYSLETLTAFIELFSINEKQTTGAFMFKTLLELVRDYCEGKKDFYQVVGYSKRV
jgi:hypothetical protein